MADRRSYVATLERDAKTGQWRGEVPEVPGVYAVGRDIAEVRARLLQELRTEIEDAAIDVYLRACRNHPPFCRYFWTVDSVRAGVRCPPTVG